jgi:hypothetical protein
MSSNIVTDSIILLQVKGTYRCNGMIGAFDPFCQSEQQLAPCNTL